MAEANANTPRVRRLEAVNELRVASIGWSTLERP